MSKKLSKLALDGAIIFLTLSMLLLSFLFASKNVNIREADEALFDELWIINESDNRAFTIFNTELCTPDIIAYKQPGKTAGALVYNSDLALTLYAVLSDVILDVFGAQSVCTQIQDVDEAKMRIENADSYLYIEYASDIPFAYIYALSSGKSAQDTTQVAKGSNAYISKLFLNINNNSNSTTYECLAFDSQNNIYSFTSENGYVLRNADKVHLEAYADILGDAYITFNDTPELNYPAFEYSLLKDSTNISTITSENKSASAGLIELFGMNFEKTGSYTDGYGTRVFIGSSSRITVTQSGNLSFTGDREPILLTELLGYKPSSKGSYSMFDMLKATNIFIDEFKSKCTNFSGGDAEIKISAVYKNASSGYPVFEYSYFFNGIMIDTDKAFVFEFDNDGIKRLDIKLLKLEELPQRATAISKKHVYSRIENTDGELFPIYTITDEANSFYEIAWAIR